MQKYECPQMAKICFQVLSFQKGQKHLKNALSTPFGHTGSGVGRTHFWRRKWTPNLEIPPVLESRQTEIYNKPTWRKFGAWECLQN